MSKGKALKAAKIVLKLCLSGGVVALLLVLLWRFEYLSRFSAVDNFLGSLPIFFCLLIFLASMGLIWMRYSKKTAPMCVFLAIAVLLSGALFPKALRLDWWIVQPNPTGGSDPPLTDYAPYTGSLTARLDGPASLSMDDDLPVLDGALALYPVYAAVAEAVYDREACEREGSMHFTNTVRGFRALVAGECDVFFTAYPAQSQFAYAQSAGVELSLTPIGREAFVFLVGDRNPIDGLSEQQIYDVYSGKTAYWRTLGWEDGGRIALLQRPEGSGSQSGIQGIMRKKGLPLLAVQPLPDKRFVETNSLMDAISTEYRGTMPALGYSYRFFATTMRPNPHAKMLSVGGISPTSENIAAELYPFTVKFYAVTRKNASENSKRLVEWLLSAEGQTLIARSGYVPLSPDPER